MKLSLLTAAALSVALLSGPAFAQKSGSMMKPSCTESGMKMADDSMMSMSDPAKKDMAMKEMDMAKSMMMKKNMKGCMMHMHKAMGMMK